MALVTGTILGEVSGKMGNKVFRKMNGKTFVSERPLNYKPAKAPTARKVRSSFRMTIQLAAKIISDPALKDVWAAAKIEGVDAYHKIIKQNSRVTGAGSLTDHNKITPDGLFLGIDSAELDGGVLHLSLNCPVENNLDFPARLYLLYYSAKAKTSLVLTQTSVPEISAGGIYDLDLQPAKSIIRLLTEDPDALLFSALVSETPKKKKAYWTSTASVKLS